MKLRAAAAGFRQGHEQVVVPQAHGAARDEVYGPTVQEAPMKEVNRSVAIKAELNLLQSIDPS